MALSASIGRRAAFFKERLPRRPDKLSWRAFLPAGLSLAAWPLLATSYVLGLLGLSLLLPMLLPASVADAPGAGDAVYSELILSMARGIHGVGLMLSVPLTDGAGWLAVVFAAGSSAVGALLLQLAVNLTLVVLTTAILVLSGGHFASSWVRALFASRWLRLGCGLTMAFAAAAQLRLPWQRGTGGDMALSMVATKLAGLNGSTYGSVVDGSPIAALGLNLTLVLLAAGAGFGFSSLLLAIVRKRSGWPLPVFRQAAPAMVVGLVLTLSPIQQPIAFERSGPPVETEVAVEVALPNTVEVDPPVTVPGASLPASATPAPAPPAVPVKPPRPDTPSVVTIAPTGTGFSLRINGEGGQIVRGVGYNPITAGLSAERRAARYDRDFALMRTSGINTVTGWDEREFDEVLLASAADHNLGVILPFDLPATSTYSDPTVQKYALAAILDRVQRYKDSPAVAMWGLGNEVLHAMVDMRTPKARAFADFLVKAADAIHVADPNHPVIYRDAEDVYLGPLAAALKSTPVKRPWFVYGMNFFTPRIASALVKGPTATLGQPLLISEFAPAGLRPADRASGYAAFWAAIRAHPDTVLGGCAYVWSINGPEPLDRGFGLTNDAGQPVDGALAALANLYSGRAE